MIDVFNKIWPINTALTSPKVFSIGYHTGSLEYYYENLEEALNYVDRFLLSNGDGPVVYVTANEIYRGWPSIPGGSRE